MYVVFAVVLCMIFTLAALHRLSKTGPEAQVTVDSSSTTPDAPVSDAPPPENPFIAGSADQEIEIVAPPDFCFSTSDPEETDRIFREGADRMKPPEKAPETKPPEGGPVNAGK